LKVEIFKMKTRQLKLKQAVLAFTRIAGLIALATVGKLEPITAGQAQPTRANEAQDTITLPAGKTSPDVASGSIDFIGNATVLIRWGGMTILTDPNFIHRHEQVSIGYGLEATRLKNPAMEFDELPPLDIVVLSHFHGDHFDRVAKRALDKSLPIITNPEAAAELRALGFNNVHPLSTWSRVEVTKGDVRLRVWAIPGRHGPPLSDFVLPKVMGSVLDFHSKAGNFQLYITGDTLVIDELEQISRRYPDIDLALLHLGGTEVLGIMLTMDGEQGVQLMQMVKPKHAIPIHYNDYDIMKSPLSDFQREVKSAGLEDKVHYLSRGDAYRFKLSPAD
jgi:L-ascorbate metabolism protein UlaG (beta-lactamase superfamily)